MYKVTIETSQQNNQNNFASPPLLSELCIKLPKPQNTPRKPTVMHSSRDEEWESLRQYQPELPFSRQPDHLNNNSLKNDSNCFIFSDARTKNSSASLPYRSESEIITEWVRSLFQKRGLLGPIWQQKFKIKRKQKLKQAFVNLRQWFQSTCSGYLQTQSLCKPQTRQVNKLLGLGFDKLLQILPVIINRNFQMAFSRILRFIAFQHLSIKMSKSQKNITQSINNSLKSSNNHLSSQNSKQFYINKKNNSPSNFPSLSPIFFNNEDYESPKTYEKVRQVNSFKHIHFNQNQYLLQSASPLTYQTRLVDQKELIKTINQITTVNEQRLHNVKEHPQIIFNNNYVPFINEKSTKQRGQQIYIKSNPLSPKVHQLTTINPFSFHANQQKIVQLPKNTTLNYLPFDQLHPNKARPHSHNPFGLSKQIEKIDFAVQPYQPLKYETRKSRTFSSSPNIKISFIASKPNTPNPHQISSKPRINDYETNNSPKNNNIYKFGTIQNRQIRQSYQVNSFQNQLVNQHQNQFRSLQPLNSGYSSPVSPKIESKVIQMQSMRVNPPSPKTHIMMKSLEQYRQQRNRPMLGQDNDYYIKRRQKLVVTSSNKRKY